MNSLLAILRDSYREAVSSWAVPAMFCLTGLLLLLVASVGFRPATLQEELEAPCAFFSKLHQLDPEAEGIEFRIENMKVSDPDHPWLARHEFDIVIRDGTESMRRRLSHDIEYPMTRKRAELFVKRWSPQLKEVVVIDQSLPKGDDKEKGLPDLRFHVTSSGSHVSDRSSWSHVPSIFFSFDLIKTVSLRQGVFLLERLLINSFGAWVILVLGVVITAGFIPNMLTKGTLDLYIAKPIGRSQLLIFKYLGGMTFVFLMTSAMVGGVWVTIGLRTGIWAPAILALVPLVTFYFAILYAVSTLVATISRSTLMAILATLCSWALFFGIGYGHSYLEFARNLDPEKELLKTKLEAENPEEVAIPKNRDKYWKPPQWLDILDKVLYTPCPRTRGLDARAGQLLGKGIFDESDYQWKANGLDENLPSWGETLGVSFGFIVVCLLLACWRMNRIE